MPIAASLIAVGMPPAQAEQLGYSDLTTVAAAGTTQGTATVIKPFVTQIQTTTAASQDGVRLPSEADLQQNYLIFNPSTPTLNVYPPVGSTINELTVDGPISVGTNVTAIFARLDRTRWISFDNATSGGGSVTSVNVATSNGFAGSSSGGSTPSLTISTTVTGILEGNGTAVAAASTTGTGSVVKAIGPTMTLPNATGLPLATGVTGILRTANGGWAYAADRTALAALDTTKNTTAYLGEGLRKGWFQWNSANLSTQVTLDTQQGVYVAPASAPTGASGAYVRITAGTAYVGWFGVVGDGVANDTAACQKFAAFGNGWTLDWGSGLTFIISSPITATSNTKWIGSSKIKGAAASLTNPAIGGTSLSHVTIDGLELDGNTDGIFEGIAITNSSDVNIKNTYIHDCAASGMFCTGLTNSFIMDNRVRRCGVTGGSSNHGIVVLSVAAGNPTTNMVIGSNEIDNCFRKGIAIGVQSTGLMDDVIIDGNIVFSCGLNGIQAGAPAGLTGCTNIVIANNIVYNNVNNLEIDQIINATIIGNSIGDATGGASAVLLTLLTNSQFSGNTIKCPTSQGIITTACIDVLLSGNTVSNANQYAINLNDSTYMTVTDNLILSTGTPVLNYGILEGTGDHNIIAHNIIKGTTTANVLVNGANTIHEDTIDLTNGLVTTMGVGLVTLVNNANNNVSPSYNGMPVSQFVPTGPSGVFNITGVAGGWNGRVITIFNYTNFVMTITHNSGSSSAANRILCPAGVDLAVAAFGSVTMTYVGAATAWLTGHS